MIRLHKAGEEHARSLIQHGKVCDKSFSFDAADKDELLGPKGSDVEHYAKHHLGEDDQAEDGDHKRYRYAFAKGGMCYKRALESIEDRSKNQGHDDVAASCRDLLGLIEGDDLKSQKEEEPEPEPKEEKSVNPNREVRCRMLGLELRKAPDGTDSPGTMVGYAAVFDRFSEDLGWFREKIAQGAFADALKQCDIRALKNHDPNFLLGRNTAGTLRLEEDSIGLRVEIDLPDTQVGRDTATEIRRGDMDGQSFSFDIDVEEWDWGGQVPIRTVHKVRNLYDVGPVTYPAYTDTTAAMRSLDRAKSPSSSSPAPAPTPDYLSLAKARQQLADATLLPE